MIEAAALFEVTMASPVAGRTRSIAPLEYRNILAPTYQILDLYPSLPA